MTKVKKTNQTLPESAKSLLLSLPHEKRAKYIRDLRGADWTYTAIANAIGVSRERVRQVAVSTPAPSVAEEYPVPSPPAIVKVRKPRVHIEPDADALARLLELKPLAERVRGNSEKYRAEAEEYMKIVAEQHLDRGVTLYRLAKRLGVTHGALRSRLARYGYKAPKTGTSRAYTPIVAENRGVDTPK